MSEVKRYGHTCDCMAETGWGDYVLASDFDKQAQEIERLEADNRRLQSSAQANWNEFSDKLKSRQSGVVLPDDSIIEEIIGHMDDVWSGEADEDETSELIRRLREYGRLNSANINEIKRTWYIVQLGGEILAICRETDERIDLDAPGDSSSFVLLSDLQADQVREKLMSDQPDDKYKDVTVKSTFAQALDGGYVGREDWSTYQVEPAETETLTEVGPSDFSSLPPIGSTASLKGSEDKYHIIAHMDQKKPHDWRYLAVGQKDGHGQISIAIGEHWEVVEPNPAEQLNKAQGVSGKYAEVLKPFLAMMENELHANAGKGDRPGWLKMDRKTALLEIYYHLGKLQKAAKDDDQTGIIEYAADVANMSMMLVDVCGLLCIPTNSRSNDQ